MEAARGIVGLTLTLGPLVLLLVGLNLRERRESRLWGVVLEQVSLPELRGRVAVQIRCGVFTRRSTVRVELLAATPAEVWKVFTGLAARLPPYVRLRVQGAVEREGMRTCALEATLRFIPGFAM